MVKRLLSLEDLYNFYANQNKNVNFSSKESDTKIIVHIEESFKFEKNNDNPLLMRNYLRFCHTKDNLNHSFISKESMKDAIPSAYNMPILGYIYKNDKDEYVFAGHEFYEDENGDTVYEEVPVGVIPESADLKLVYDEKEDKYYLEGYGLIWKTYSHAAEILERETELSVSVELEIEELSYNAADQILQIEKFMFSGVTILQENRNTGDEIKPGMRGANITIADFSSENNSVFTQELIKELKKFNENFETLNSNNNIKQGGQEMNLFEELLAKYGVTEADVTFEHDGLSDEELEKAFADAFSEAEGEEPTNENPVEGENENPEEGEGTEFSTEDGSEPDDNQNEDEGAEIEPEGELEAEDNADKGENTETTFSVTLPNGSVKTFSLSLNEIEMALNTLANDTYGELDNDIFSTVVYPDDKQVVMCGWFSGRCFRQGYKRKKDTFTLEGERVEVHQIFVSDDEQKMLDDMKANYSVMENKLANYEAEPEKVELLNSEDYAGIKSTEEYAEISKRENYFEMSKEDLAKKLDDVVLKYAKQNMLNFSANEESEKKVGMKPIITTSKVSNYGSLLKDI